MTPEVLTAILAGIIGSIIGAIFSALLSRKYLTRKTFTPSNAIELLKLDRPEEWNEVRIINPGWKPDLKNAILDKVVIPGVNLRQADLSGASLRGATLDDADLFEAKLNGADFTQASLLRARLDNADLREANLIGAIFNGASLKNARLGGSSSVLDISEDIETTQLKELHGNQLLSKIINQPELIDKLTPAQFEDIVASVFRSLNYDVDRKWDLTDEGYDLLVTKKDPINGEQKYIVEAKRTKKDFRVGASSLRALYGALLKTKADRGFLVTTNELTASARRFAEEIPNIVIIDRNRLFDWLKTAFNNSSA